MKTIKRIKEAEESPPEVEEQLSSELIEHIRRGLEELGKTEVLSNPMWTSRSRSDTKDEPLNEQFYLHGEEWPEGLSEYVCERSTYKGEIVDFLLNRIVGFPKWGRQYIHLLDEEDFKSIFKQLKAIGELNKI